MRAGARPATRRARSALVVAQVAISSALLIGAGLFLRSLHELSQVDTGIDLQRVHTARVGLDFTRYGGNDQSKTRALADRLVERLAAAPGTVSVAVANAVPLRGTTPFSAGYIIEGQATDDRQPTAQATFNSVTPEYFRTLGIPLVRGRGFTSTDRDPDHPVVVVNQSLARHRFASEDPIGRRLSFDGGKQWVTIVGVVGDTRQQDLTSPVMDEVIGAFAETGLQRPAGLRPQPGPAREHRPADPARRCTSSITTSPVTELQPLAEQRAQALAPAPARRLAARPLRRAGARHHRLGAHRHRGLQREPAHARDRRPARARRRALHRPPDGAGAGDGAGRGRARPSGSWRRSSWEGWGGDSSTASGPSIL